MDYFVGLDVSLRSVAVCVIDAEGGAVLERSVACETKDNPGRISKAGDADVRSALYAALLLRSPVN